MPMAEIVLVTGGCRSGKSGYAQRLAELQPPSRLFVATCPVTDDELLERIAAHQRARRDRGWETVEEQVDLASVLRRHTGCNVVLVDCVTLWVNNVVYWAGQERRAIDEAEMTARCEQLVEAAREHPGSVIFVSNEVGMGIVPDNAAARHFRDLAGRVNQTIAAAADQVTMLVSGIPWVLKNRPGEPTR
jgi:adenosylcobinamide kinase/adenosylcobinamide-phosphate guanylyltransferase